MIITAFYAGVLGLLYLVLSLRVVQLRRRGIPFGDGGDPQMLRVIRGHANFAEYVPLILVMMLVLELGRTSLYVLHALGIVLVAGRVLHGYALSVGSFQEREAVGRDADVRRAARRRGTLPAPGDTRVGALLTSRECCWAVCARQLAAARA
jgi:uncharacterized membrane protein YecN with MAPEG domain